MVTLVRPGAKSIKAPSSTREELSFQVTSQSFSKSSQPSEPSASILMTERFKVMSSTRPSLFSRVPREILLAEVLTVSRVRSENSTFQVRGEEVGPVTIPIISGSSIMSKKAALTSPTVPRANNNVNFLLNMFFIFRVFLGL